jgi:hypothetical protein
MKKYSAFICFLLIISYQTVSYSQKITTGIYSGVNFSDIHGQDFGGKWESKPGPVQGFYLGYSLNKTLGIQTGINFTTIYYEHKSTSYPVEYYPIEFNDIIAPYYYQGDDKMDFSFLRVPLLFTVQIPAVIQFNMRAGLIFSFMQDHSLNYNYYYYSSEPGNIKKQDFGYMFSSGISYPLSDKFKAAFNVSYITGRKQFLENSNFRHGSSEFTLGIYYEFFKNKKTNLDPTSDRDSSSKKVTVTYDAGINVSLKPGNLDGGKYSSILGPSLGFSVNIPLGVKSSFQTGFSFERKGYSIKDSSSSFYTYIKNGYPVYYVDTKVQIDYAIIPMLLRFAIGKSDWMFISTGPFLGLKLNARNVGVAYNETRSESGYSVRKIIVYDDIERLTNDNDIGWIFSSGVSLPLFNKYKIDLALQYSSGFKNVYNKNVLVGLQGSSDADHAIKNNTISFKVGFTIPSTNHNKK